MQAADAKARQVQEHLLAVAFSVAKEAPTLYGPSNRLERARDARERARARRERMDSLLQRTTHQWCSATGKCLVCLKAPSRAEPKAVLLAAPCKGRPHQIHPTHRLRRHRGLWFCDFCGATGSRRFSDRGLAGECHKPTEGGLRTLAKIRADILPYHVKFWPDEEGEAVTGLELVS